MDYTKDNLQATHDEYEMNADNWQFLANSYHGGIRYKAQNYLTRYIHETDKEYR